MTHKLAGSGWVTVPVSCIIMERTELMGDRDRERERAREKRLVRPILLDSAVPSTVGRLGVDGFWVRDYGGGVRVGRPVGAR